VKELPPRKPVSSDVNIASVLALLEQLQHSATAAQLHTLLHLSSSRSSKELIASKLFVQRFAFSISFTRRLHSKLAASYTEGSWSANSVPGDDPRCAIRPDELLQYDLGELHRFTAEHSVSSAGITQPSPHCNKLDTNAGDSMPYCDLFDITDDSQT